MSHRRSPRTRRPARLAFAAVLAGALTLAAAVAVGPAAAAGADTLTIGSSLASGAALTSGDGRFRLVMQTDGNLVQYAGSAPRWWTGTDGNPGARLDFQGDGNIVVVATSGRPLWFTGTYGSAAAATFVMQSDGNQVAYNRRGAPVWQSNTVAAPAAPPSSGPYTSPSGKFRAGIQGDGNVVVSYNGSASPDAIWATNTGGHPGARLVAQSDGNLVVYDGSAVLWQSGTSGFPGAAPRMQDDGNFVVYAGARPVFQTNTANVALGIGASGDRRFSLAWAHATNGPAFALGSPGTGTLDGGGAAVVAGNTGGAVYAHHLSDGSLVTGWPRFTGVAVQSTPSVLGSGSGASVFVGLGSAADGTRGGIVAFNADGTTRWNNRFAAYPDGSGTAGVQGSVTVGALQTPADVISGTMNQMQYAYAAGSGATLGGFPWFGADSNFTTPAIVARGGRNVIVQGGDSTAGVAFGRTYVNGGHVRILAPTGRGGSANLGDGLICSDDTNQVVQGSPAVGRFLPGGQTGIVSGLGTYWPGASDTNTVIADNLDCGRVWQTRLDGGTGASPSLIDVDGDGADEVVEGTNTSSNPTPGANGSVWVLNAANGAVERQIPVRGNVYGSVTSVDLGNGRQTMLVPTSFGVYLVDAVTGSVSPLVEAVGVQNTPTVTVDPDGRIGVTVVGYNAIGRGVEMHYVLNGSTATTVSGPGRWPMFHHDPQLTGVAGS